MNFSWLSEIKYSSCWQSGQQSISSCFRFICFILISRQQKEKEVLHIYRINTNCYTLLGNFILVSKFRRISYFIEKIVEDCLAIYYSADSVVQNSLTDMTKLQSSLLIEGVRNGLQFKKKTQDGARNSTKSAS